MVWWAVHWTHFQQLSKVVIINDYYFIINDEFWLQYNFLDSSMYGRRGPVIFRGQGATDVPLLQIIEQKTSRNERERVGDLMH